MMFRTWRTILHLKTEIDNHSNLIRAQDKSLSSFSKTVNDQRDQLAAMINDEVNIVFVVVAQKQDEEIWVSGVYATENEALKAISITRFLNEKSDDKYTIHESSIGHWNEIPALIQHSKE